MNFFWSLGTHWIRISQTDSKDFALLPIFAFDDDYVPLSPIGTPAIDEKTKKKQPKIDQIQVVETSDVPSSRASSITSPPAETGPNADRKSKLSKMNGRKSPEVQILDITDLNDPGVRVVSKFSFTDVDNKFQIKILGKFARRATESISAFRCGGKSNRLSNGIYDRRTKTDFLRTDGHR